VVSARQVAYLQALGVDVYVPRDAPQPANEDLRGFDELPEPRAGAEPAAATAPLGVPSQVTPAPAQAMVAIELKTPPAAAEADADADKGLVASLDWDQLRAAVAACQRCELHATRTQTVFGVGNPKARWMFIGEAPGADEDKQGEPFVGRAGQLLTSMIRALGLRREDVYIANVVKCRPPGNRDPKPAEAASCRAFLERQVALVDPTLVVAVGRIAAQDLLATETPIAKLRGKVHSFGSRSWPLLVTYHPAYLLRSPSEKRKVWQDLLHARNVFARLEQEAAAGTRQ
jgi:DNA polymerase